MTRPIHDSQIDVRQLDFLGFFARAPSVRISAEDSFGRRISKHSIRDKVHRCIDLYHDDLQTTERLRASREGIFAAVLEKAEIGVVSRENMLATADPGWPGALTELYRDGMTHNQVEPTSHHE